MYAESHECAGDSAKSLGHSAILCCVFSMSNNRQHFDHKGVRGIYFSLHTTPELKDYVSGFQHSITLELFTSGDLVVNKWFFFLSSQHSAYSGGSSLLLFTLSDHTGSKAVR